jgi:hygromycin-B 7''-O-kinase
MPYEPEIIRQIAVEHGLSTDVSLLPDSGMANEAWLLGDGHVLRIIRDEEGDDEAERENLVMPLVLEAEIPSPRLVACDLDCKLVPRPYTIYERAEGELLGNLDCEPDKFDRLFYDVGRHAATLHRITPSDQVLEKLRRENHFNPRKQFQRTFDQGKIEPADAADIECWLDRLEAEMVEPDAEALIHKDIHPWNLFANPETGALTAIIDWGDSSFGDPALEFVSMPLFAVPQMIEGYRAQGGKVSRAMILRSIYSGIGLAVWEMRALDAQIYRRDWWRLSEGGWAETARRLPILIEAASK